MAHRRFGHSLILAVCGLATLGLMTQSASAGAAAEKLYIAGDSISYSKETLKTYAMTALELRTISQRWQPRIASAKTEEEAIELENMANAEMVDAVETKGLSVEQFNSISAAARQDPQVNQEIMDIIAEETPQ